MITKCYELMTTMHTVVLLLLQQPKNLLTPTNECKTIDV